jgi:hypothetical protein
MRRLVSGGIGLAVFVALALSPGALGLTVMRMGLGELCTNGFRIFRGTVLASTEGSAQIAGASVPVVTYRLRVDESFKGAIHTTVKGERIVELRTIGKPKAVQAGRVHHAPLPFTLPQLEIGASYVLFTTRPGESGLATTVGLGQGCFKIAGVADKETAANELDNAGLFAGTGFERSVAPGPVAYDVLARSIRETLASQASAP